MKKAKLVIGCFVIVVLLLISFTGCSSDGVINLNYSVFFPATHIQAITAQQFADEIEKRTDGRVKITVYFGGTLTAAPQVFDGVEKGLSDMGMSCYAYTRGRFPVTEAADLPLGYKNGMIATQVVNEFVHEIIRKGYGDEISSVKTLYVHAHGPGLLHTVSPVRRLEDLRNMQIRATGLSSEIVSALGGVPIAMAQGETYEALQKGVVEGTFGPMEVLKGWKQGEVINYTTDCYDVGYTTSMFVIMNKQRWESLPDDIKEIFKETSKEFVLRHGLAWDASDEEGKNETLNLENEIITLTDGEKERWRQAAQKVIDNYINKTENGAEYVRMLRELIDKYSK